MKRPELKEKSEMITPTKGGLLWRNRISDPHLSCYRFFGCRGYSVSFFKGCNSYDVIQPADVFLPTNWQDENLVGQ